MRNRQQGDLEYPSPLVGEDRLGAKAPSEEGGRRGRTRPWPEAGGFEGAPFADRSGAPCPAAPLSARPSAESALPHEGGEGAPLPRRRWFAVVGGSLAAACVIAAFALWSFANSL